MKKNEKRRFFGREIKQKQSTSEKKHLKAYLRGDKYFFSGKDELGTPMRYIVDEIWQ